MHFNYPHVPQRSTVIVIVGAMPQHRSSSLLWQRTPTYWNAFALITRT